MPDFVNFRYNLAVNSMMKNWRQYLAEHKDLFSYKYFLDSKPAIITIRRKNISGDDIRIPNVRVRLEMNRIAPDVDAGFAGREKRANYILYAEPDADIQAHDQFAHNEVLFTVRFVYTEIEGTLQAWCEATE